MAGPFPGMDPYLEFQAAWPDFHNRLTATLPETTTLTSDERVWVESLTRIADH